MAERPDRETTAKGRLDPERWRRADALFARALEREGEKRSRFLDEECRGDPGLRRLVEELLENDAAAGDFLESPALAPAAAFEDGPAPRRAAPGDVIGPYRIERELAQGGMGSVYLAYRADDAYQRQVAIKLLDRASEALVRRFRSERQILASLDHPHVARLFEGGETPDGRPYLVMEYVDGEPIDDYCDRHSLPVEERLALFARVCSAVHYAHQNLIVHRDVKPSNVLVNAGGEPRLLDFGIAKLLDPASFPLTLDRTATGVRPMTPDYASPEQVRGETITTASDVYSLGVLLYKLLTGRLPHRLTDLSLREVERVLSDETPAKMSAAALRAEGAPATGLRAQALARRLTGDLDNIVAMALRREPGRRYGSVELLARDLENHLAGRPVTARRDTFGYRANVFLRRNKVAAAAAAAIFALIVAFAVSSVRQAAETARQRDRAELERDKAKQVSAFLVDLFREVDPWEAPGSDLTVREVLDRGAVKIKSELEDSPEVRATLQEAIGTVYTHLGLHDQAAPHLETALETLRAQLGEHHIELAAVSAKLATVYRRRPDYDAAERLYLRALEILEAASLGDHPDAGEIHRSLTIQYRVQGRFAEAQDHGERSLEIMEEALGPDHSEVGGTLAELAGIAYRQSEWKTAADFMERALDVHLKAAGENNLRAAAFFGNLGLLRQTAGDLDEAQRLLEKSLALHEQLLVEPHQKIANVLVMLANLARDQQQDELAEGHLRRALGLYERTIGAEHDLVAGCLYPLGMAVFRLGRADEAVPLLERALEIRRKVLGADHHWVALSLRGLGEVLAGQGRHAEAERHYLQAMEIWERHPRQEGTQGVPEAYAALLRATGREAEAGRLEERAAAAVAEADSGA